MSTQNLLLLRINPTAKQYCVSNCKLLSIKSASEEQRHWLEGAQQPFLILTNHRNPGHDKSAKQLKPCKLRSALFFTRFHLTFTCRPSSKNSESERTPRTESSKPPDCPPTKSSSFPMSFGSHFIQQVTLLFTHHSLLGIQAFSAPQHQ